MTWIAGGLGAWVVKYRWWILLLTVPLVALAATGIGRLTINNDMRVFFGAENPDYQALKAFENTYSRMQNVMFVVAPRDGDVFTPETLTAVAELTERGWQMPYSLRVNSIANFQRMRGAGDDLIVEDLVPDPSVLTAEDLSRVRRVALSEATLVKRLLSPSGHVTGVFVAFVIPSGRREAIPELAKLARETAEEFRARYPHIVFYLTGSVIIDDAFGQASRRDLWTLAPVMFAVIAALTGLALRTFFGAVAAVAVIVLSMVTAIGLTGWFGISLNAVSVGAPGLILMLAIADSVHILSTMFQLLRQGRSQREAVAQALRINLQPVFLTSITTVIGFLSMNFSESPPFRDLGNIVGVGVTVAFFYSVLLLPALMAVLPVSAPVGTPSRIRINCDRVANLVIRRREVVFWLMLVLAAVSSVGIAKIELNDNFLTYFDDSFAFRRATDFLIENMTGWDLIEYSLPSGRSGGITDPNYLTTLDRFADWYRRQPKVVYIHNVADTIKRLNRDMHGGDEAYYHIPDQADLVAQYLLFYELSLPQGHDLNHMIDVDRSATRFDVVFESMSAKELRHMDDVARQWLRANVPAHMYTSGTGLSLVWARIAQRNILSMLKGCFGALVLISGIMIIALRSVKFGLISLVPNLLPPLMAFGIWGLINGQVGLALSVVVAMTIGIVVDDTVHFLSKYRRARHKEGLGPAEAVHYAFQTVGTAMWVTSVALVAGFLVLTLSHYRMSSEMGIMCAMTIALALVMDFLLLPTLLLKADHIIDRLAGKQDRGNEG